jgi:hypothetical protein
MRAQSYRNVFVSSNAVGTGYYDPFSLAGTVTDSFTASSYTNETAVTAALGTGATVHRPNGSRAAHYWALQNALQAMGALPEDHDFHVSPAAIQRAADLLGVIVQNFDISPPRVLPQDGEAVVFTWDYGAQKRYLTVDEDDMDIMDLDRKSQVRCVHNLDSPEDNTYEKLVSILGAQLISTTSTGDDVQR